MTPKRAYPENPLVGVGAVVFRGEDILMIKRTVPPRQHEWSFPGGLQNLGETVFETATSGELGKRASQRPATTRRRPNSLRPGKSKPWAFGTKLFG